MKRKPRDWIDNLIDASIGFFVLVSVLSMGYIYIHNMSVTHASKDIGEFFHSPCIIHCQEK